MQADILWERGVTGAGAVSEKTKFTKYIAVIMEFCMNLSYVKPFFSFLSRQITATMQADILWERGVTGAGVRIAIFLQKHIHISNEYVKELIGLIRHLGFFH